MNRHADRTLDRLGAASGVVAVVLLLSLFTVFPALPAPNTSIAEIARSARQDADGLLLGAYVGALLTGTLLVFGSVVAARLRRAEGACGGWWLVALAGIGASGIGIVGDVFVLTFVRAVRHGAGGDALWIGYGADHWAGTLVGVPLAVFLLGAGLGARAAGVLPRWLAWLAVAASGLLVVGAGSVTGDEVDGGVLGLPLLLGYVAMLVWIVGASVTLWRHPDSPPRAAALASEGAA
jgi:hypothetical protein